MPSPAKRDLDLPEITAAAVRLLAARGYEATTAGELADAAGMSRSTFFRRFRSKDDVVFADHERLLDEIEAFLDRTTLDPARALARAARMVLDHHLANPEAAVLRYRLLRETPTLRDRELVITHGYERLFTKHLERALPSSTPVWMPVAYGAGVVAVHNSILRRWLRDPSLPAGDALDAELAELGGLFASDADGGARGRGGEGAGSEPRRVVVAVMDAGASTDDVLRAVERGLREREQPGG